MIVTIIFSLLDILIPALFVSVLVAPLIGVLINEWNR